MNKLEKKAVKDLKCLIRKIENGEFNITETGFNQKMEESNVRTKEGAIQIWETSYSILHYRKSYKDY